MPPSLAGSDKRSTILRAAHKLFLRDGFSVTSMDAVTAEAGVSKATVYAHFASKQKLFETLIRDGSDNAIKVIPPLVRRGNEPADELLAFFEPFLTMLFRFGGHAWSRLVVAEARRHPENAELFFTCTIGRLTGMVEEYLKELAREGALPVGDARLAAETLIAVVLSPLHRVLLLGPEAVDFRASLRFGIGLILKSGTAPGEPSVR